MHNRRMNSRFKQLKQLLKDEKGMTMIELMTALVLMTMVIMILFSFLFMGTSMYTHVNAETNIRSQGDALISQVISELKDAVYVTQETSTGPITFVEKSTIPNEYIQSYTMKIEALADVGHYGIGIYNSNGTLKKQIALSGAYTLDQTKSTITIPTDNNYMVQVHLYYLKYSDPPLTGAKLVENPGYEINTQIPLFRSQ